VIIYEAHRHKRGIKWALNSTRAAHPTSSACTSRGLLKSDKENAGTARARKKQLECEFYLHGSAAEYFMTGCHAAAESV